jgi:hypothetical protein
MWRTKVNCRGQSTPAVMRRLSKCKLDISSHKSRSEFGYCYLERV